ncbi:MAG: pyridoxamine 5'-phosphate oxidase family protein [Desulfobacterales bacterium]|nr:pyridoxamine 5'-phosphate oxidase family protein [Desulfobacterales bacterium]
MRRKEKEITDKTEMDAIIRDSQVCRLGLADAGVAYIVPLCFGYDGNHLYFHSAREGRKIEILNRNNRVCFEFEVNTKINPGKTACAWGMNFRSVIGYGTASFVEDSAEKCRALDIIMGQYADGDFEYADKALSKTLVIKVEIHSMTGKKSD